MKDFLGKELKVGDTVVALSHSRTSSHLFKGVITSFTPQKAYIQGEYCYGLRTSDKIVKVDG